MHAADSRSESLQDDLCETHDDGCFVWYIVTASHAMNKIIRLSTARYSELMSDVQYTVHVHACTLCSCALDWYCVLTVQRTAVHA